MAAHQVKVVEIKSPTEKLRVAVFEGPDGQVIKAPNNEARFWADNAFADLLKAGETVSIEVEKKPAKNDPDREDLWLKTVNGTGATKGRAPGGGGARSYQPKSAAEIHSASVCGILKSCIETGKSTNEAADWLALYRSTMAAYGNCTEGRVGAS